MYFGDHSITFGEKHTWRDWHLIPTTRPVFNPPAQKTNRIDISGGNGILDLSEILSNGPVYSNREGSFEFIVENGHKHWATAYSDIMNYLHGRHMRAILDDDPEYYYEGRFAINQWKSDPNWSVITIDYNVAPYKRLLLSTLDDWLWDPFNFETGIIRNYKNISVSGSKTMTIYGTHMPVTPEITVSSGTMTITYEGQTFTFERGTSSNPLFIITDGPHDITITGNGTISIGFRGGSL